MPTQGNEVAFSRTCNSSSDGPRRASLQRTTECFIEREHELRNGLAGLAGASFVLRPTPDAQQDLGLLQTALTAEIARLHDLLGEPACLRNRSTPDDHGHPVVPVLHQLVALRRASGMTIDLDVEPSLRMWPEPQVLAQVLTNLLANCAQHAPGAPVRVQASQSQDRVRVQVSDLGPGIAPGVELAAPGQGARISPTSGSGLGLTITRQLLAAHRGEMHVVPPVRNRGGFTVVVELPAADGSLPAARCQDRSGSSRE